VRGCGPPASWGWNRISVSVSGRDGGRFSGIKVQGSSSSPPTRPKEKPQITQINENRRNSRTKEPRSGGINIAWGVSPRNLVNKKDKSREAATPERIPMAAAYAAAKICRPSRAPRILPFGSWGSRPRLEPVLPGDMGYRSV
jgi:hypothetical protein